jgi:cell division protease FtsH
VYSDETAFQIDSEIKAVIDSVYTKVQNILKEHEDVLRQLAQLLLEKEVIEHEEFERIVNGQDGDNEPAIEKEDAQDAEQDAESFEIEE